MDNYKIPKRARRQLTTLTGHPPPANGSGVPEDPKDNMERVSILHEPLMDMNWEARNELAANYWTRSDAQRTSTDNNSVQPGPSHVAPSPGSSQGSSSVASDNADAVEMKKDDVSSDTDTEPIPEDLHVIEPHIPFSPVPSSITSGYNSSEISSPYSPMDSQGTSDEETLGNDDDEEEDDEDVLIIGLSKKERKEVDRWDKLLSRRE